MAGPRIDMPKTISYALAALLASAIAPPPAAGQNREHQQMTADVRMLQEQTQQLAITLAAVNQALAESLEAINARLDQARDTNRQTRRDGNSELPLPGASVDWPDRGWKEQSHPGSSHHRRERKDRHWSRSSALRRL